MTVAPAPAAPTRFDWQTLAPDRAVHRRPDRARRLPGMRSPPTWPGG